MKNINYIKLYNYFREVEGLSYKASLRNIWRVRKLPNEFKNVILEIIEDRFYNVGNFSVDGVTLRFLVEEEQMKCIQAVFLLDWMRREPVNACAFMASKRYRSVIQPLSEDERNEIRNALDKARIQTGKDVGTWCTPEDKSGEDIEICTDKEEENVLQMD